MEKTARKIKKSEKEQYIKYMEKFDWKLIDQIDKNNKVIMSFERDDKTPYYSELKEIEKMAIVKVIPLYVLLILMIFGFTLLTSFIIVAKVQGESFNTLLFMGILIIPALLDITAMVVISYIRNKQITAYMNEEVNIRLKINKLLDELKTKYDIK